MSHKPNQEWLETKYEVFRYAMEQEDWELAKELIDQMFDAGFNDIAVDLGKEMLVKKSKTNVW